MKSSCGCKLYKRKKPVFCAVCTQLIAATKGLHGAAAIKPGGPNEKLNIHMGRAILEESGFDPDTLEHLGREKKRATEMNVIAVLLRAERQFSVPPARRRKLSDSPRTG
jgi:hypothetical protein